MWNSQTYLCLFVFLFFSSLFGICYIIDFLRKRQISFFSDIFLNYNNQQIIIKKILMILLHVFLSVVAVLGSYSFLVSVLKCEDLRLLPSGTYCYYVEATNSKGKTYTLPAEIIKSEGEYTVHKVYFNNGGYLYLDTYNTADFDETLETTDQDERDWDISFTNHKTYHHSITETKIQVSSQDVFVYLIGIVQIFIVFLHIRSIVQLNKEEVFYE